MDDLKNFALGTIAIPPSPALSGTSMTLAAGVGALMPTPPFNLTLCPAGEQATAANAEIVRVNTLAGDVITDMTREAPGEDTTAKAIAAGWQCAQTATKAFMNTLAGGAAGQIQYNNAGAFGGVTGFTWSGTALALPTSFIIGSTSDLYLARDAAGILAQRNSTNAQTFRLYNTYTDASNYERLSVGWAANVVTIKPEAAGTGTLRKLAVDLGTVTASTPLSLTQTWNNAGVTFTGVRVNVTNTASASDSMLLDVQLGGTSVFRVRRSGLVANNTSGGDALYLGNVFLTDNGTPSGAGGITLNGNSGNGITFARSRTTKLAWSASYGSAVDVVLDSDAADTLAQRRTTNAQTFRLYNTYTDASNYERLGLTWSGNVITIGPQAAGTGTQRQMAVALGTVTADTPLNITQTWNNSGVTFTGLKLNVTNTASAAASLLLDLQVGGSSIFKVSRTASEGITYGSTVLRDEGSGQLSVNRLYYLSSSSVLGLNISSTLPLSWGSSFASADVLLYRDAANTLAQRNSTNAQTFRLYNTYTDASNYELLGLTWSSNVIRIGAANAGTGTARVLAIDYGGTTTAAISVPITSGAVSFGGGTIANSGTAIPAGGTAGAGVMMSSTTNFGVFFGSGAPTLSAAKGSLYLRSDGSTTNNRAYINTDGGTTWTALTTAA